MSDLSKNETTGQGFQPAPIPDNETERLREVAALGIGSVDSKDPVFNDILQISCAVADTQFAVVNILERPQTTTLFSCGLPIKAPAQSPTDQAVCQFTLLHGDVLIIEDLQADQRTKALPVARVMRFYAGVPLINASGFMMGTLCVTALEPRTLDARAVDALRRLADLFIRLLEGGSPSDDGHVASPAEEKTPARGRFHSQSSILFTDFVGFTRHTEALEPAQLLETLARYFGAFDKICERFELTRIKTIGDSYMAAAGIPTASVNHARDAVGAALAIRNYVAAENNARAALGETAWDVRIGVHSGPAISGSLSEHGNLDIWGNTVNGAARLEAASEPGHGNISEATLTLLGNATTDARGALAVKNKDPLQMYFVEQLD